MTRLDASFQCGAPHWNQWFGRPASLAVIGLTLIGLVGCGTGKVAQQHQPFFTSGSREADQRASQRMAKAEQLAGTGEGAGDTDVKKASGGQPAQAETKKSLYDRLGGESGLSAIVDDFTPRVIQDPRINWTRKGISRGGLFHHSPAVNWDPSPEHVATLKQHMVQFLALATGGPAQYQGGEMKTIHEPMQISNPEFDAAMGDIKASLDKLRIPNQEQKELLAVIESTRPEIVTVR